MHHPSDPTGDMCRTVTVNPDTAMAGQLAEVGLTTEARAFTGGPA